MKNKFRVILILIMVLCSLPFNVSAKEDINLYFFHGDGCPHCADEEEYLKKLEKKYKNLKIHKYEVWNSFSNSSLMNKIKKELGSTANGVPFTVVGSNYFEGFNAYMEEDIENAIKEANKGENPDVINGIVKPKAKKETTDKKSSTFNIPILGKINVKEVSLPIIAIIIGIVDGFNPCAMWVLLFLISMLLGMKNKKRMWTLGLTFLFTSAFIYMLFMLSWLNIIVNIAMTIWLRNIIALLALGGGIFNLYSYYKSQKSGCIVVDDKKRSTIFKRIKKFTTEKSFWLALIGIIALAVSVNLIELACSAGLPVLFVQILAINDIGSMQAFFYTLLYILFFLIDDIIVFVIAMITLNVTGISTKYNKYSHLIGGIIMLIIGALLIFKPEWLMFNFK